MLAENFTVGNTVTLGVALYKNQWKKYLQLSLIAHLWLLIPIYGWARYFAIAALISKLSLQEINDNLTEDISKSFFSSRSLTILFITAFITIVMPNLLSFIIIIVLLIAVAILNEATSIVSYMFTPLSSFDFVKGDVFQGLVGLLFLLLFSLLAILFYAKIFTTDLTFESQGKKIFRHISQSWHLSRKSLHKIIGIIWLSFTMTFPVWFISYFFIAFVLVFIVEIINNFAAINLTINTDGTGFILFFLLLWVAGNNLLTMPFWQSIKAITYFQLYEKYNNFDFQLKPRN